MAEKTPQFTIKTGADSSLYFSREVTVSDKDAEGQLYTPDSEELGKIKARDMANGADLFEYPTLVRRTGDSLKGTTESIESNELRKGRTKSAPRKGSSSSEGSLDFEFSPETYDDIMEATLRDRWTEWQGDSKSKTNLDNLACKPDYIFSMTGDQHTDIGERDKTKQRRLVGTSKLCKEITAKYDGNVSEARKDPAYPLVVTDAEQVEVHELSCGTEDIRYSILKNFGGVKGDDLYQEFEHCAVNSVSMEVTPGQIVTGSFSFMGANNPDLVQNGVYGKSKIAEDAEYNPLETYYVTDDAGKTFTVKKIADADEFAQLITDKVVLYVEDSSSESDTAPSGLLSKLAAHPDHESRFLEPKTPAEAQKWIDELPQKGTSTDQYTAREGFLYVSGERVRYGSTLSFELNNGLEKTFAIFERDAIALSPMSLDITGTLGVYLIKDYSEKLYNLATKDKDVELLFTFQDKEDDPEALYTVQILKNKFTDTDFSSGAQNLEVSFPFQSFEEQAMRILRTRKRRPYIYAFDPEAKLDIEDAEGNPDKEKYAVIAHVRLSTNPNKYINPETGKTYAVDEDFFKVEIENNGNPVKNIYTQYNDAKAELFIGFDKTNPEGAKNIFTPQKEEQKITLKVTYNGITAVKTVVIPGKADDGEGTLIPNYTWIEKLEGNEDKRIFIKNSKDNYSDMSDVTALINEETLFLPELDEDGNPNDWRNVFYVLADEDTSVIFRDTESPKNVKAIFDKATKYNSGAIYYELPADVDAEPVDPQPADEAEFKEGTFYVKSYDLNVEEEETPEPPEPPVPPADEYELVGDDDTFDPDETYYTYSDVTGEYSVDGTVTADNFDALKGTIYKKK